KDLLVNPVKNLIKNVGDSAFSEAVGGAPRYVVDKIGENVRKVFQLGKVEDAEAAKNNPAGDGGGPLLPGGWRRPSSGRVTSRFGYRPPIAGVTSGFLHNGIDYAGGV